MRFKKILTNLNIDESIEFIEKLITDKPSIEEVLIKADENSNAGNLSEVIKIIRSSGIERAAIVTKSYKN